MDKIIIFDSSYLHIGERMEERVNMFLKKENIIIKNIQMSGKMLWSGIRK